MRPRWSAKHIVRVTPLEPDHLGQVLGRESGPTRSGPSRSDWARWTLPYSLACRVEVKMGYSGELGCHPASSAQPAIDQKIGDQWEARVLHL